jgi:hypothetical protein
VPLSVLWHHFNKAFNSAVLAKSPIVCLYSCSSVYVYSIYIYLQSWTKKHVLLVAFEAAQRCAQLESRKRPGTWVQVGPANPPPLSRAL